MEQRPTDAERIAQLEAEAELCHEKMADLVRQVEGLHEALGTRAEIEQAKGIIMQSVGCTADAAFALLVVQSQTENRKLREIAVELAHRNDA